MRGGRVAFALVLGSLATCARPSILAKAEANHHEAEIVRTTRSSRTSGGGEFGPSCDKTITVEHVELGIDELEKRDVAADWKEGATVELVAAPDGDRFAYRMNAEPWRPVWRGKSHAILGGDAQRIASGSVDWSAVPAFGSAAKDIFRHAKNERSRIVDELRGTPELPTLLRDTVDTEGELNDSWSEAFAAVAPADQSQLKELLTKRLLAGEKDPNVILRYAAHAGIHSENERRRALETLASVHTHAMKFRVKDFLVVQAARVDLAATAAWACQEIARYEVEKFFYPVALFWVMAKARHSCKAALPQLEILNGCKSSESAQSLEKKIDTALGKLVDDPAAKNAPFIGDKDALVAFATRTLTESERAERCKARP